MTLQLFEGVNFRVKAQRGGAEFPDATCDLSHKANGRSPTRVINIKQPQPQATND